MFTLVIPQYSIIKVSLDKRQQRTAPSHVVRGMMYSSLTIKRETDGQQVVRRPRVTDAVGHALRNAFSEQNSVPDDMAQLLSRLDGTGRSIH
ncbi:hypothetical protein [Sphingomonas sp. Leaf38]|uniref:hypothetical protein n=1 Tax=Sphingomonas sp. Leaf38 TaxID=1736217 RepID=UPI00138F2040|nr:hypothetical protein [Sphingomonas sp. Leaf38]